jgi:hypothetical protein
MHLRPPRHPLRYDPHPRRRARERAEAPPRGVGGVGVGVVGDVSHASLEGLVDQQRATEELREEHLCDGVRVWGCGVLSTRANSGEGLTIVSTDLFRSPLCLYSR